MDGGCLAVDNNVEVSHSLFPPTHTPEVGLVANVPLDCMAFPSEMMACQLHLS